jgi:hypothetical protein
MKILKHYENFLNMKTVKILNINLFFSILIKMIKIVLITIWSNLNVKNIKLTTYRRVQNNQYEKAGFLLVLGRVL